MPYAGIVQSTQYVFVRRKDVGFRYDCLGREGEELVSKVGVQILELWKQAPIVYELCKPDETDLDDMKWLLHNTHGSIVHNNNWDFSTNELEKTMLNIGYRYLLNSVDLRFDKRTVDLKMAWQNIGSAPNYPRMGQDFQLYFHLLDSSGSSVFQAQIPADISTWLPASVLGQVSPTNWVTYSLQLPSSIPAGNYQTGIAIQEMRTGESIKLSIEGQDMNNIYLISQIDIE
jgi:hypothetical protein